MCVNFYRYQHAITAEFNREFGTQLDLNSLMIDLDFRLMSKYTAAFLS